MSEIIAHVGETARYLAGTVCSLTEVVITNYMVAVLESRKRKKTVHVNLMKP